MAGLNGNGDLVGPAGRFRPEAIDLRGALPLILIVAERDGSLTYLAPDNMNDHNLETLKASFFKWLDDYKRHRQGQSRIWTPS